MVQTAPTFQKEGLTSSALCLARDRILSKSFTLLQKKSSIRLQKQASFASHHTYHFIRSRQSLQLAMLPGRMAAQRAHKNATIIRNIFFRAFGIYFSYERMAKWIVDALSFTHSMFSWSEQTIMAGGTGNQQNSKRPVRSLCLPCEWSPIF